VLHRKHELNHELVRTIQDTLSRTQLPRLKLTANLPYAVAVPVISNFLISGLPFERMIVTVQWEIAERLLAEPASKEYAALAVLVQNLADVSLVRKLAPSVFWPKPEVDSAIVCVKPSAAKRQRVGDVVRFKNFLRDLHVHRRKNLRGALSGSPSGRREKADVDRKLSELGIDGTMRAETLTLEQHRLLCAAFG
jgi:16S rRNA (adenine1518-N6/adenine1519-N6)-dimethyltransferase